MDNGFIILHRKLTEWQRYQDGNTMRLFLHLLLQANHKKGYCYGVEINRGQHLTGRKILSKDLNITEQQIRTSLVKLEKSGNITIKTTNRHSIVEVINYNEYQQNNQQITNKQPTDNQQITTNNNDNNKNNNNNKQDKSCYVGDVFKKDLIIELDEFIEHWNSIYSENRKVTEKLIESYMVVRKKYSKEDFRLGYSNYNKKKAGETNKQYLLSPIGLITQKNGFINYL